jgi:hypothetical protein
VGGFDYAKARAQPRGRRTIRPSIKRRVEAEAELVEAEHARLKVDVERFTRERQERELELDRRAALRQRREGGWE